jgi:uncharacterized protein (UPF0333 family)
MLLKVKKVLINCRSILILKENKGVISLEFIIITVLAAAIAIGVVGILGPSLKDLTQKVVNTLGQRIVGN